MIQPCGFTDQAGCPGDASTTFAAGQPSASVDAQAMGAVVPGCDQGSLAPGRYRPLDDGLGLCDPYLAPLHDRFWVRSEYLLWWTQGFHMPVLVETGSGWTGTFPSPVKLTGASPVLGDGDVMTEGRSGVRFTVGYELVPGGCADLEANYFFLGQGAHQELADSSTASILGRPYYDQFDVPVTDPAFMNGNVLVNSTTDFQGAEVLFRQTFGPAWGDRLNFLAGYRYAHLADDLEINQFSRLTKQAGQLPADMTWSFLDSFRTSNDFHGGELGLAYRDRYGRWSLELVGKAALGNTSSQVTIAGSTVKTYPAPYNIIQTSQTGVLANAANSGTWDQNEFSVISEFGARLGFDLTQRLQATLGYTFIGWSGVVRAGDQIDTSTANAHVPMTTAYFWAQGANVGLDYRF
jgi:hypothetical protein